MYTVSSASALLALAASALAAPGAIEKRAPTIYLAGDSTMAEGGGGTSTQGWGHYLQYSISGATVVNDAVAGRSARSYTREGRFQAIANVVKAGDIVLIEFGHNDGGSLTPTDNGRTDCYGADGETCQTTYNGVAETVLTYPTYLINAAKLYTAKGAYTIFSSPTPDNPWETGTFTYTANRFTTYCQSAAVTAGSMVEFIDHGQYTANIFKTLGATTVDSYYPIDHTHTSPAGADTVAKAFVKGLLCKGGQMASYIKNTTASVQGSCI